MSKFIRKYKGEILLVINLLVFVMFTLTYPHLAFDHSFLKYALSTLLSIPTILLLVLWFINGKREKGSSYNRVFNVLGIINNFLFILTLTTVVNNEPQTLFTLMKGIRAPLAIIYFLVFITSYFFNIFELLLSLGFLDKVMPEREVEYKNKKKAPLDRDARNKRLEEKVSSLRFFLLISAILSLLFFIVPLVSERFTIPLGGDYTQQQIPFYTNGYDDWWRFLKTGEFPLWDHNTFLGADNIGSNSYYYTLNPFFLPILLFPRDLIPQGMAILMMAKLVLAVFSMRAYLKYMGVEEMPARFFAIMYAFCGWNTYNLWFNSFMEVVVILPLIFLGVEKILKEKKIMLLVFSLGLMGIANYFFLMTFGLIAVIYAVFRYFQKVPKVDPSVIGFGILAFALGLFLSSVVLFPSLAVSLSSDRAVNASYLDTIIEAFNLKNWKLVWDLMSKWETRNELHTYKKFYPLISYYFPVLSDRSVALLNTSSYDNTVSSVFSFSPVILLLIPSIYNSIKEKKWSHLLAVAFFIFALFTPFFYHFFHGFTNEYGRWQLIVPFAAITYVAISLPKIKKQKPVVFDISFIVNLIIMAFTVKIAFSYENKSGFSYMYEREYIIFYQFVMFFVTYLLFRFTYKTKNGVYAQSLLVFVEVIVMGAATMVGHGFISYKDNVTGGLEGYRADEAAAQRIGSLDESFYRIYNARIGQGNDNLPERANYNGLSTFHSLYNFELMEFNEWSKLNYNKNGWSLAFFEKRSMLYDFLSVKYNVFNSGDNAVWFDGVKYNAPYKNVPNTYEYRSDLSTDTRFVYKMKESFDVGFGVDYAVTHEQVNADESITNLVTSRGQYSPVETEEMYLKSAILKSEDLKEVLKEAPHLGSKNFGEVRAMNSYAYNSSISIDRKYYEYDINNRYPFEAQLGKNKTLPTPTWLNENADQLTVEQTPSKILKNKHVIEYTRKGGGNIIDGPGEIILNLPLSRYNSANYSYNYRYRVFLYDTDYNLITVDDHAQGTSASRSWKVMRSYHTPVAVKKLVLMPYENVVERPVEVGVYIYNQSAIDAVRKATIDNSLQDVVTKTNTITFKTNYEESKFVVTTIPYDPGWAVKVVDGEDLPVYKVQGGFVGFLSEKGETNYLMKFTPRYFNLGLVASVASLLITLLISLNMYYYKKNKKKKQLLEEIFSETKENKNIIIR